MAGILIRGNRAEGYPGKGFFGKPVPVQKAHVNRDLCQGCGECVSACFYRRITVSRNGKAKIRRGCEGCAKCRSVCPSAAIIMIDNV